MPYTTAEEIAYLHELFSRPPAIVEACNRVHAREKWSKRMAWWKGVFWGLASVALVFGLVMAIGWWAE